MGSNEKEFALDEVQRAYTQYLEAKDEALFARKWFIRKCAEAHALATQKEIAQHTCDEKGHPLSRQRVSQFLSEV